METASPAGVAVGADAAAVPTRRVPRVLLVGLSLAPGGTERLIRDLADRLRDEVAMAVCCIDERGAWGDSLAQSGIPVSALRRRPGFRPWLGARIASIAAAHRADVIHCHQYSPFVYGCIARCLRPARLVFTEHGRLGDRPPSRKRFAANQVLRHIPNRVFTVSEDLKRHLVREGFAPGRVEVIYNGIDIGPSPGPSSREAARRALGLPAEAFIAMAVGRLDPVKDYSGLVRAFARVLGHRRDGRLVLVGDGPERPAVERAAAQLGIAHAVTLAGHREDVNALLPAADVFVNSSEFEGISLTILEAMAACLPVVATRVGGTPEIVSPETGVLVPAGDADALASALVAMAADAAGRRARGIAGRRAAEQRFSLDRMINQYLTVYRGDA
jgi:glycosyltransferase involved in cell wall biosynthesis